MRYRLFLPFMVFMLSCNSITGLGAGSAQGSVDYDAPADPLDVTVVLNEADSASGSIPPEGGQLTLSSADGSTYTLEVPAGALDADTEISMTSVESIEGTSTGDGLFAVQLEPSGLSFNALVTLTITPAIDVSGGDTMFFKYEGNGEDLRLALVDPFTEEIDVLLLDFSGIGYGAMSAIGSIWRIDADKMVSGSPGARLESALGEAAQRLAREKTKAGQTKAKRELQKLLDEYRRKIVDEKIRAAKHDCSKVNDAEAALRTLGAYRTKVDPGNVAADKKARAELDAIKKGCPKIFNARGSVGPYTYAGVICDINKPFELSGSGPGCDARIAFGGGYSGAAKERLQCEMGVTGRFEGSYTVWTSPDGARGRISGSATGNMVMPIIGNADGETHSIALDLTRSDVECAK